MTSSFQRYKRIATLTGHQDRVWSLEWSPDGRWLASCSGDHSLRVWGTDADCGKLSYAQLDEQVQWSARFVADDAHERTTRRVAWSSTGEFLACCSFDASTSIWRVTSSAASAALRVRRIARLEGHESEVKGAAFGPGDMLATCSRDKSVWIWEIVGSPKALVDDSPPKKNNNHDNDDNDDNDHDDHDDDDDDGDDLDGCEGEDGAGLDFECVAVMHGHAGDVKHVVWHPQREQVFSCSYDDTIKAWEDDGEDWSCSATLRAHASTIQELAFNKYGSQLASVSDDLTLRLWNVEEQGAALAATLSGYHERTPYSLSWGHCNDAIATGAGDNAVRVFQRDPESDSDAGFYLSHTIHSPHAKYDVNVVRWHPKNPHILASGGDDGLIHIWCIDL